MADGTIVGAAAAAALGHRPDAKLAGDIEVARRELARQRRFQAALWRLYRAPRLKTKQRAGSMLLGAELAIGWWLSALLMNFARSTRATHRSPPSSVVCPFAA